MAGLITLEGPDGAGKSTQIKRLAAHLEALNYDVLLTREPGGTLIGQQIRQVLMNMSNTAMAPEAEFLLFSASRAQLVHEVIRPHLAKPKGIVVCDRFFDSSLAYQGYGHGLDLALIEQITACATGGLRPDLTILLDVDPETGLQRRQTGDQTWNRLDDMTLAFHRRVHQGYHALAEQEPERWRVVDAARPLEAVTQALLAAVDGWLARMGVQQPE